MKDGGLAIMIGEAKHRGDHDEHDDAESAAQDEAGQALIDAINAKDGPGVCAAIHDIMDMYEGSAGESEE